MKYHLCQTPDGPQLARTQPEAAKLDKAYVEIDIDTSKDALMDMLNDLYRRLHIAENGVVQADDAPKTIEELYGPRVEVAPEAPKARKGVGAVEERMNRTWDQIAIETYIFDVPVDEAHRLDRLSECITTRRGEITAATTQIIEEETVA